MNAAQVLSGVIDQFGKRVACLRELVQNAIDAGTNRIDVVFGRDGAYRVISVEDYGSGMTREEIDKFLLNVFKSSKEGDLTSIGKFGIGFVSVFGLKPAFVVVDTSKDDEDTRVIIDQSLGLKLVAGEPRMGTRVSLLLKMGDADFAALTQEGVAFLSQSCRFIETELVCTVEEQPTILNAPFELTLPYSASLRAPGTQIVAGYGPAAPVSTLMNRRLVLAEEARGLLPGLSVLASSQHIEHNLARNAVLLNDSFTRFTKQLERLVADELLPKLIADFTALESRALRPGAHVLRELLAMSPGDRPSAYRPLLAAKVVPCIVDGRAGQRTVEQVAGALAREAVWAAADASALATCVSHVGLVVVSTPTWPIADLLAELGHRVPSVATRSAVTRPQPSVLARFAPLTDASPMPIAAGRVHGQASDWLTVKTQRLDRVIDERSDAPLLVLNVAHPLARRLADLAQRDAPLASHLLLVALENIGEAADGDADKNLTSLWGAT